MNNYPIFLIYIASVFREEVTSKEGAKYSTELEKWFEHLVSLIDALEAIINDESIDSKQNIKDASTRKFKLQIQKR